MRWPTLVLSAVAIAGCASSGGPGCGECTAVFLGDTGVAVFNGTLDIAAAQRALSQAGHPNATRDDAAQRLVDGDITISPYTNATWAYAHRYADQHVSGQRGSDASDLGNESWPAYQAKFVRELEPFERALGQSHARITHAPEIGVS